MKNRLLNVIAIAVITTGIIALSLTGCDNGTNSANNPPSTETKLEGRWLNLAAINNYGYTDLSFTFTDNNFIFRSVGPQNNTYNGSFTFIDTTITFIPASGQTWQTFTQGYTLSGNVLNLAEGNNIFVTGPFKK